MNLSNEYIHIICENILFHSSESLNGGNIPKANKAFKLATKKICEIMGNKRFDIFFELLFFDNYIVQEMMLLFLLPINEKVAMKRLHQLKRVKENSIGFDASMLIKEYKKGRLKYPILIDKKVVYVDKEVFLEQFNDNDIKYIAYILKEKRFT